MNTNVFFMIDNYILNLHNQEVALITAIISVAMLIAIVFYYKIVKEEANKTFIFSSILFSIIAILTSVILYNRIDDRISILKKQLIQQRFNNNVCKYLYHRLKQTDSDYLNLLFEIKCDTNAKKTN